MYRSERLELRLTPHEVALLDRIRGSASRSAWIRNQIARAQVQGSIESVSTDKGE